MFRIRVGNSRQLITGNYAQEVFAALKRRMNPRTRNLFPRYRSIAKELGISESTVVRNMRYLLKMGRIRKDFLPAMNPDLPEEVGFTVITIPAAPEEDASQQTTN